MRIRTKLIATLLLVSALLIAAMALLIQWSIQRGMLDYVNVRQQQHLQPAAEQLANLYRQQGSWQSLIDNERGLHEIMRRYTERLDNRDHPRHAYRQPRDHHPAPGRHPPPRRDGEVRGDDQPRGDRPRGGRPRGDQRPPRPVVGLYSLDQRILVGALPYTDASVAAIVVDDVTVGWLGIPKRREITDGFELQFLQQQQHDLIIIAALVLLFTSLVAIALARHFVSPIQTLTRSVHQLTQGQYSARINDQRSDELGSLARDFNELARSLEDNDNNHKRWMADISHELRTPVTILRGELEAMLDGIRVINRQGIESMHQEILHLQHLINDLHELNASDIGSLNYRKQSLNMTELVGKVCHKHKHRLAESGLQLNCSLEADQPGLWGDQDRLQQLLDNLLTNCQKYCDKPGTIQVSLKSDNQLLILKVEDSGPGVPAEELGKLFDPLYRQDPARQRRKGQHNQASTGLGLAICERIVRAHEGEIKAQASALGGLAVIVCLPHTH